MISSVVSPKTKTELISRLSKSRVTSLLVKEVSKSEVSSIQKEVKSFLGNDESVTIIMVKTK